MEVNLTQGSPDWLEWRKGGIGASDAPALMLEDPWVSVRDLFLRKMGRLEPRRANDATRHGQATEQPARDALGAFTGEFWAPACFQDDIHPYMRCSLDGWNGKLAAEIKCPTTEAKWQEMSAAVPLYYKAQLQWQMLVTETDLLYFWPYFEGKGNLLVIERDDPYIVELGRRAVQFWNCVELDTYPPESFFKERLDGLRAER